jgi:hypothetical protein
VIGSAGTPTWVPAAAQPYVFGADPANAPIDLDPAGLGGFITIVADQPPAIRRADDWFTVESVGDAQIRTRTRSATSSPGPGQQPRFLSRRPG